MTKHVTGRCFCGAVTFQFDREPLAVRACWCRDCQYLATGNASVNAIFKAEGFQSTGELSEYVSTADSGNTMSRRFCPKCGTHLFSQSSARPELMVVRVGTLDNREDSAPQSFIWTASAPRWGHIDHELPNCTGQPAPIRK
ncbi:MAG: GFA family protein [Dongiaceae bacterium]